jgi:hypothetical protein
MVAAPMHLKDVTGSRGEKIAELELTNNDKSNPPRFRTVFLGEKWPTLDLYVELDLVKGQRPFFFVQCKSTSTALSRKSIRVRLSKSDVQKLRHVPGPTYLIAVHEPTRKAFLKAVHAKTPISGIGSVSTKNELNLKSLKKLHAEVVTFWKKSKSKPVASVFP